MSKFSRARTASFILFALSLLLMFGFLLRQTLWPQRFPVTLAMGNNTAVCLAFSPDGKILAAGGGREEKPDPPRTNRYLDYGQVRFWNTHTHKQMSAINSFGATVQALAFSPDGQTLATGTQFPEGKIILWNVQTGQQQRVLGQADQVPKFPAAYSVYSLAFSSNGQKVAAGYEAVSAGEVRVWSAATGAVLYTLKDMKADEAAVRFSPDGAALAAVSAERIVVRRTSGQPPSQKDISFTGAQVRLFDSATGRQRYVLPGELVTGFAFSPDGKMLASVSHVYTDGALNTGGVLRLVNLHSLALLWTRIIPGEDFSTVSFSPNGDRLLTQGSSNTVTVWEARTGLLQRTFKGNDNPWQASSEGSAFSPNGYHLASCRGKQLLLWDAASRR